MNQFPLICLVITLIPSRRFCFPIKWKTVGKTVCWRVSSSVAINRDWRNELAQLWRDQRWILWGVFIESPLTHSQSCSPRGTFAATLNHCSRVTEFFRLGNRLHLMFADSSRQWDDFYVNSSDKTGIYRSMKHAIFLFECNAFYEKLFLYPLQPFKE